MDGMEKPTADRVVNGITDRASLPSRDECTCSCHRTGAVHIMPCCTGISKIMLETDAFPNSTIDGVSWARPDDLICARYSTPGLRKNELSRTAKRDQLREAYKHLSTEEREALLDRLYPPAGVIYGVAQVPLDAGQPVVLGPGSVIKPA